jgi:MOSC domain-containing protein YiiM
VASVVSVNVGRARPPLADTTSAFRKEPVAGPVRIGRLGLEGDEHADGKNHGGAERAVLMYAEAHYPFWRDELGRDLPYGGFAENLTVRGLAEADVCIGDSLRAGDAVLQVACPRAPCWKIGARWEVEDLMRQVTTTARIGWLLRVLEESAVEAGSPVEVVERPHPELTVEHAYAVFSRRQGGAAAARELAGCALLTPKWREALAKRC